MVSTFAPWGNDDCRQRSMNWEGASKAQGLLGMHRHSLRLSEEVAMHFPASCVSMKNTNLALVFRVWLEHSRDTTRR